MTRTSRIRSAKNSWLRFVPILILAAVAAFVVGTRVVVSRPVHPLTGRIIPGMATNTAWLDRPERGREEAPGRALELVGITPGMSVADIGAGTGYLTVPIARLVGPTGRVFANDVQPAMLQIVQKKVQQEKLTNVETIQGTADDARLPPDAVDLALLVDVYHELSRPQPMLQSIRRSLRTNGRLVVIEYRKEDPTIPIASTHRMSLVESRVEVEAEGFVFERAIEELPRHHVIVFRKN